MINENAPNLRRSSRTVKQSKPRDSNPFGALDDSVDSIDSRRSSWANTSRRNSRLSSASDAFDLIAIVEDNTTFAHLDLLDFDETKPAKNDRRKTFDAPGTKKALKDQQSSRRSTFAPTSTMETADLLVFSSAENSIADTSTASSMKRSWSNQSPSASALSFERSSDRKRSGPRSSRKSPGNTRRMTVDPDDLAALMNEFDEQTNEDESNSKISISIQDITSAILGDNYGAEEEEIESSHHETEANDTNSSANTFATNDSDMTGDQTNRRATADPAALAAMMAELNDSAGSGSFPTASGLSTSADPPTPGLHRGRGRPRRDSTPNKSSVLSVTTPTSERSEPARPVKSSSGKKSFEEETSDQCPTNWNDSTDDTTSSSIRKMLGGRRTTADAADMEAVMNALEHSDQEEDALNTSTRSTRSRSSVASATSQQSARTTRSKASTKMNSSLSNSANKSPSHTRGRKAAQNRRQTADPADMAALLDGLENDHENENSFSQSNLNCRPGRESIDTVILTRDVADMLNDIENVPDGDSLNISTLSYSVGSAGSISSRRSSLENVGGRRMTADCGDLAALAAELDDELNGDNTEPTVNVIESVRAVLGQGEDVPMEESMDAGQRSDMSMSIDQNTSTDLPLNQSVNLSQDDSTNQSLCSLGALLRRDARNTDSPSTLLARAPASPSTITLPSTHGTGLKSCLSTKKQRPSALKLTGRKSVAFGSPKAAEFIRGAPTNAMTPLDREQAKSLFSMVGSVGAKEDEDEDEVTAENSRMLDEWDRLTNTTGEGSDDEVALPSTPSFEEEGLVNTSSSRRRKSMLHCPEDSCDASQVSEATGTVELPGDLSDLLRQNVYGRDSLDIPHPRERMDMSDECTQELEVNLQSVLRHVDYDTVSIIMPDANTSTSDSANTSIISTRSSGSTTSSASGVSLGPLIGLPRNPPTARSRSPIASSARSPDDDFAVSFLSIDEKGNGHKHVAFSFNSSMNASTTSEGGEGRTVQLEGTLGDLLDSGNRSTAMATKKVKRVNTPHKKVGIFSSNDDADSSTASDDDDRTEALEINLNAMVAQLQCDTPSSTANGLDSVSPALSIIPTNENELSYVDYAEAGMEDEDTHDVDVDDADISNASTRSLASPHLNLEQSRLSVSCIMGEEERGEPVATNNSDRKSLEVSAMMARLRTLNAGARQNSLSQCGTPLAPSSRLSIGIKRQSILNSASRAKETIRSVRMLSMGGQEAAVTNTNIVTHTEPEPAQVVPVFELVDILKAANLTSAPSVSESPFSLSAALNNAKLQSQENPALYPLVACAIIDLLKAAVEEARNVPADLEALAVEWNAAPPAVVESVNLAVSAQNGGQASFLPGLAASCKALCTRRWGVWEGHLLDIGTSTLEARIAAIQANIRAIRAQKDKLLESEREMNDTARIAAKKVEIEKMQTKIRAARNALETSKQELLMIGSQTSDILESHKDHMVSLAAGNDRSAMMTAEAAVLARMQEQDDALQRARRGVDDVRMMVGVVNRLSYCRTTSYTSSGVEIEALLSAFLRVSLRFNLCTENGELVVSGVNVELEKTEIVQSAIKNTTANNDARERDLAEAFFVQVLCNNEIDGALSPRVLERIAVPADIPSAIHKVCDRL